MTEESNKLRMNIDGIITWAWRHKIPKVPYAKGGENKESLCHALEIHGILPDHDGIFEATEAVFNSVLTIHRDKIFHLSPKKVDQELKRRMHEAYCKDVRNGRWDDYFFHFDIYE